MSAGVELDHVTVRFGEFTAVNSATLDIKGGEFFSFLGPSGCGKTTILRTVSGFLEPSEGAVRIGGQDMAGIGPNKRPTALIFQNLALFPLMTVAENITYGLRVRGIDKATRAKKADELLELIALPGQGDKLVSELSGGQKQRVAIARALVRRAEGAAARRAAVGARPEAAPAHAQRAARHPAQVGITFIYITHDQGEALTMSDRIAVMNDGVIEQVGDGRTIYDEPATAFVASFVGENNPFAGRVAQADPTVAVVDTAFGRLRGRNPRGAEGRRQGDPVRAAGIGAARAGRRRHDLHHQGDERRLRRQMTPRLPEGRGQEGHHGDRRPARRRRHSRSRAARDSLLRPGAGLVLPEGKMARE